jgi:hypothetical protein
MTAFAQEAAPAPAAAMSAAPAEAAPAPAAAMAATPAPAAAAPAAIVDKNDKGDNAWMLVSTLLVLLMILPGLALFYGGLVRTKNMLSVMMQVSTVAVIGFVAWVLWGYSFAFTDGGSWDSFVGGLSRLFLKGVTPGQQRGDVLDRRGDPRVHLHLVPDDLRGHHRRPGGRFAGRAHEVRRHRRLRRPVAAAVVLSDGPHGLVVAGS